MFGFRDHDRADAPARLPVVRAPRGGVVRSIRSLIDVDLDAPDHTTLARRRRPLNVARRRVPAKGPIHCIVVSPGLALVGEGEGAAATHGGRCQRDWKTLHLGVDRTVVIVAHPLIEATADDATTGIGVITALDADIARVTTDAAYDTIAFRRYGHGTGRGRRGVPTQDGTCVSTESTGERAGSHDHEDDADRPPAVDAGVGLPPVYPSRERLLSGYIDHQEPSSRSLSRRPRDGGGARVQHAESHD